MLQTWRENGEKANDRIIAVSGRVIVKVKKSPFCWERKRFLIPKDQMITWTFLCLHHKEDKKVKRIERDELANYIYLIVPFVSQYWVGQHHFSEIALVCSNPTIKSLYKDIVEFWRFTWLLFPLESSNSPHKYYDGGHLKRKGWYNYSRPRSRCLLWVHSKF